MVAPLYVALDALSAAATLSIVGFFLRTWRRSGAALHLLMAVGFLLVAGSYALVAASEFDLAGPAGAIDALRLIGQTFGAVVLALAYVASRGGRAASPLRVLAASAALVAAGLAVGALLGAPFAQVASGRVASLSAHAAQALAFATCAWLSFRAFRRQPAAQRALVPGAFLLWTVMKYTWVLIDVSGAQELVGFAYASRFVAIGLLQLALWLPARAPAHERRAEGAA
jgi:hypothetical protein